MTKAHVLATCGHHAGVRRGCRIAKVSCALRRASQAT